MAEDMETKDSATEPEPESLSGLRPILRLFFLVLTACVSWVTVPSQSEFMHWYAIVNEADPALRTNNNRVHNSSSSDVNEADLAWRSNISRVRSNISRARLLGISSINRVRVNISTIRANISRVHKIESSNVNDADQALRSNISRIYIGSSSVISTASIDKRDNYFQRKWSMPDMRVALQNSTGMLRKAFLITTDISNPRTRSSLEILEKVGFVVVFQPVIPHPNKMVSNRLTHMELFRKISVDKTEPWGYIFENDIQILNESFRVNPDIIAFESRHKEFMFLGMCMSKDVLPYSEFYCGNCAHAYALTPEGARNLLNFSLNQDSSRDLHPQDTITYAWCLKEKGFPVVGMEYRSPQNEGHFGLFYQDRHHFPSRIGHY